MFLLRTVLNVLAINASFRCLIFRLSGPCEYAICLGVFAILLFNVMELLSVVGGALLDRRCMVFHRMCVLCLWSQ